MNEIPMLTECPKCKGAVTQRGRFCVRCGEDFGKQYAKPKPKPERVSPWELACRACGKTIDPDDAFERDLHFDSGYELRNEEPKSNIDPWAGKPVLTGFMSSARLLEQISTDAETRQRMLDDPLWARRMQATAILNDIPVPQNYRLIRALVLPCAACGEADPLGIV